MAEELKKHVSEEALQEALKVVKNNMPGVATADKPGLVKPGSGLNVDSAGALTVVLEGIEVDPGNIASATKTSKGVVQVGAGLNVASGVVSVDDNHVNTLAQQKVDAQKFKTINGQSIKGEGEITIDLSLYKVVETLPTTDIDTTKIYLVRNTESVPDGEQNVYVEYMYVNGSWEKVGEYKTSIDLSPYAKTADVNAKLAEKVDNTALDSYKEEVTAALEEKASTTGFNNLQKQVENTQTELGTVNSKVTANETNITALQTSTSDAEMKKKYPILAKSAADFVTPSELEALCMTAADGKALAEGIFRA